jgi:23S rRNA (cytidine2498-2'-O)-methyltransferase
MIRRTLYTVPETPREARDEFRREAVRNGVRFLSETGEYFLAEENSPDLAWATDIAWHAFEIEVPSIAQGAKNLKRLAHERAGDSAGKSPRWLRLDGLHHRRAALIAEDLARGEAHARSYLRNAPRAEVSAPLAGFFLLSPERAVAVFDSLTPYPGGGVPLAEEKRGPPSRAYLKLWEIWARLEVAGVSPPRAGETALDLGSCPGGWTWALAELGAEVFSIDGASIDPGVEKRPEVTFLKGDAFRLPPRKADWIFSDMICEPKRLPELIARWRAVGCGRFALSVKFKGEADLAALEALRAIPGAGLRHLRQNKHELTWFLAPGLARI